MAKQALVVDSDYFFVEFLSELLETRGYEVAKAYDGKEAVARLEQGPVDILFADVFLHKVDGRQLIEFSRMKFDGHRFPIVIISGTVVEQLGKHDEIGADYYIAKGPINMLRDRLNLFLAELETNPPVAPKDKTVLKAGHVYPRRDAMELINSLRFHRAVFESAGLGIILIDRDTRILSANPAAYGILDCSALELLNRPCAELFSDREAAKLIRVLKRLAQAAQPIRAKMNLHRESRDIRVVVTAIQLDNEKPGWVMLIDGPGLETDLG
jgi:PAS domain S-box-containing protein